MSPRVRMLGVLVAVVLALVGCGDDDGDETGAGSTSTTTVGAQFCETASQLAGTQFGVNPAQRNTVMQELSQLKSAAPAAVQPEVATLETRIDEFFSLFDQLRTAAQSGNQAQLQQVTQQFQQLGSELTPAMQEVGNYVTQTCPGVTWPSLPSPPAGG